MASFASVDVDEIQTSKEGLEGVVIDVPTGRLAYNAYMKMHGWSGDPTDGTWATPDAWGVYGTALNYFFHYGLAFAVGARNGGNAKTTPPEHLTLRLSETTRQGIKSYAEGRSTAALTQITRAVSAQREATTTFTTMFGDENDALKRVLAFWEVVARRELPDEMGDKSGGGDGAAAGTSGKTHSIDSQWACDRCTFLNERNASQCGMCENARS